MNEFEARELARFNKFRAEEGLPPLATHKIVCPACKGEGTHLTETLRGHAYTQADIEEMGYEEFDEYMDDMRAGVYDQTCGTCNGLRVVDSLTESAVENAEWQAWLRDAYETEHIYEMERRMGA